MFVAGLEFLISLDSPLLLEGITASGNLAKHAKIIKQLININIPYLKPSILLDKLSNIDQIPSLAMISLLTLLPIPSPIPSNLLNKPRETISRLEQRTEIGEQHKAMVTDYCQLADQLGESVLVDV